MPAPPMKEQITIFSPMVDANGDFIKDDYGRYKFEERTATARVQQTTKIVQNKDGQEVQALLEIDLPSTEQVAYGYKVNWIDRFGVMIEGIVLTIGETLNYGGDKVYFRTVHVG